MKLLENKIPPPVVTILFAILMWGISRWGYVVEPRGSAAWVLICMLICVGLGFAVAGVRSFRAAATTVNPLKPEAASALVTAGVYQVTRNPMYVGLAFLLLAWGVYLGSFWAFAAVPAYIAYISRFQIVPEEQALLRLFGTEFENYMAKVRRWL